ncbi:cytochrome c-type biogenesis protein CcmH [Rheinheimera mesophila]|uniref:Cytochrome c-type biogenesis protein n=1 Tax=Rheinheimera mesophila TaxID=1547515 RepID=A0A3P3QPC1_9GAMM|nr:cytochrome c-type biogenesis protein [Rheinheimera mesophila]KKL02228.1 cytochrome C biogenesis protein [Rheinheimera mesophila]RRJ23071.1 cytochrome c-type biogenesis protein CcmH [Rheinheimera mesophila]
MRYFLISLLLLTGTVQATEVLIEFKDPQQQALFKELTQELRCPKCQNQNIADSNAVVAVDMRNKTLELVQQGQNKQQVLEYMKSRYGDFVHYLPPVNKFTLILWVLPVVMVVGLMLLLLFRRRVQAHSGAAPELSSTQPPELEQQLDQLIEQYRRKS